VLSRRQPDLTVVLENIHDPHNVSAVLRSCDAVGVLTVHLIYTMEEPPMGAFARRTSGSATKWIEIVRHASIEDCYRQLTGAGIRIVSAAIAESSRSLYELDLTAPTALVFGNEMRGLSEEAIRLSDCAFEIPMRGMIESLNISVACGVALFEAARQRALAGAYDSQRLGGDELERLTANWLRR
jgi:tRNA (guanosine-2'-O-)-methyltransferase